MLNTTIDNGETDAVEIAWQKCHNEKCQNKNGIEEYVTNDSGGFIFRAFETGEWMVVHGFKGQAADLETAKSCCIRYAQIHKLHMFAKPETRSNDSGPSRKDEPMQYEPAPYDRGEEMAYRAGECPNSPPPECLGCQRRIMGECDGDGRCPEPDRRTLQLIDEMISELQVIRDAECHRLETGGTVLDEFYYRQTDKSAAILNNGIEQLLTVIGPPQPADISKPNGPNGAITNADWKGFDEAIEETRHPERKAEETLRKIAEIHHQWKERYLRATDSSSDFIDYSCNSMSVIEKALEISGVHGVEKILKGGGQ